MKKFFKYLFSFLLAIPMIFALTACGPSEDDEKNPEFAKFSTQAVAVMSAVDMTAEDNGGGVNLAPRKTKNVLSAPSTDKITEIFNNFKNHTEAESIEDVNAEYSSCLEVCFTFPLGFGDVITNQQGANSFYGVKARVDLSSIFDGEKIYATFIVENSGNVTELYMFDPSAGEGVEKYSYMRLTYVSKTDYNFEFVDFTEDFSNFIYAYGDSSQNFINLQKHTNVTNSSYGGYVSNGISCYYVADVKGEKVQENTEQVITEKNPLVNYLGKINATKTGSQYTVKLEDAEAAYEKYVGKSNEEDKMYPIFVNKHGVVESCGVGDDFNLETLVIPAKASALSESLYLNPGCKKLVIPDSVTSIKIQKHVWYTEMYNGYLPEDDPTRNDYVDAPLQYVLQWFRIAAGYNWDNMQPVELVFSENNKLFKMGEDGNVYLNYAGKEILAYVYNFDAGIVNTLCGDMTRARNDFRRYSTRDIPTFTYNAIEQLKYANHKFKEIIFNGNIFQDFLLTKNNSGLGEYVVDSVISHNYSFAPANFYEATGGLGFELEYAKPETQKVTRIKELIILPEMKTEYRISSDPQVQAPDYYELKEYIDQNYPDKTYDEVLDNIIPKMTYIADDTVWVYMNKLIKIDKIVIDSSVRRVFFQGYFDEDTVIEIESDSTEVNFADPIDMPSDISFPVNIDSFNMNLLERFQGNVELRLPYTQKEFEFLKGLITAVEDDENYNTTSSKAQTCDDLYALVSQPNSRYTLKFAEDSINLNIIGSDIEKYLNYKEREPISTYYNNEYYLCFTNMVKSIDLSKYIICGTNWDFEVYLDTTDYTGEPPYQTQWTKLDSKVVNVEYRERGGSYRFKLVGTNPQTYETKEITLNINTEADFKHYISADEAEFNATIQYEYDGITVIKDSLGNVVEDNTKVPINYGKNIFNYTSSYYGGDKIFKVVVIRAYPTYNIEDVSKTTASIYDDISSDIFITAEQHDFTVRVYDLAGNLMNDNSKLPLNQSKNVYKIVVSWESEGSPSDSWEYLEGTYYACFVKLTTINITNIDIIDLRDYHTFDTENYDYYIFDVCHNREWTEFELDSGNIFELNSGTLADHPILYLCAEHKTTGAEITYAFKFVQIYE